MRSTPSEDEAYWWVAERLSLCNGVFQGGRAKGLAYVGALQAVREPAGSQPLTGSKAPATELGKAHLSENPRFLFWR
jgi:hypothetical protein